MEMLRHLIKVGEPKINPPGFLVDNIQYECIMGSMAYGVTSSSSDIDIYGFCIPPKDEIFPHLRGEIPGFGRQKHRFEIYQQHHIMDHSTEKEYDVTIYSIIRYFQLCMENNPNMIDSLFVPVNAVLHSTEVGNMIRDNRKMFLHKGCWHKFKGYSYSQLHKMQSQNREGKRKEVVEKYGYDVKFAMHVVRLMNEVEQILIENDLDLQRNKEQLKSIRRGDWKMEEIIDYFNEKEKSLETLYTQSKLPHGPDEDKIKDLLLNCLEHHYGNLDKCVVIPDKSEQALRNIKEIVDKTLGYSNS